MSVCTYMNGRARARQSNEHLGAAGFDVGLLHGLDFTDTCYLFLDVTGLHDLLLLHYIRASARCSLHCFTCNPTSSRLGFLAGSWSSPRPVERRCGQRDARTLDALSKVLTIPLGEGSAFLQEIDRGIELMVRRAIARFRTHGLPPGQDGLSLRLVALRLIQLQIQWCDDLLRSG